MMGECLWRMGTATLAWCTQPRASGRASLCCPALGRSCCANPTALHCRERTCPLPVAGGSVSKVAAVAQVAVANDGRVFVGDGYCNSRVVEYSAEGQWHGEFVLPSTAGEPLRNPHSIVLQECEHALYVAEREASRVHRFSLETSELEGGSPWGSACYSPHIAVSQPKK